MHKQHIDDKDQSLYISIRSIRQKYVMNLWHNQIGTLDCVPITPIWKYTYFAQKRVIKRGRSAELFFFLVLLFCFIHQRLFRLWRSLYNFRESILAGRLSAAAAAVADRYSLPREPFFWRGPTTSTTTIIQGVDNLHAQADTGGGGGRHTQHNNDWGYMRQYNRIRYNIKKKILPSTKKYAKTTHNREQPAVATDWKCIHVIQGVLPDRIPNYILIWCTIFLITTWA